MSTALLDRAAELLGGRGRPGRLAKVAAVGAALSVAPLRFLTQRVSIPACVVGGQTCGSTTCCCDGYTAFCCQLTGGSNSGCPSGNDIRGWWKCDCYAGTGLCSQTNVRYYLDCTRVSGTCTCKCATSQCSKRRSCCNSTPYTQCDSNLLGVVTCRLVTCVIPSAIGCLSCASTPLLKDPNTCVHDAACLNGPSCTGPAC
jgi:hypothetical protein